MGERPIRLRLSRAKGFDLQATSVAANGLPAVNVARPSKWGNPFTMDGCRDAGFFGTDEAIAQRCVGAFRTWLGVYWRTNWDGAESERARTKILDGLPDLRGKNLACWCPVGDGIHCHADVLLELANPALADGRGK